jgi:hypothetical protein
MVRLVQIAVYKVKKQELLKHRQKIDHMRGVLWQIRRLNLFIIMMDG